jgi:prepilin-type N-terminal cleavage/methylation domain-containing protein
MRRGYSLIEILFVVLILGILAGSLIGPFQRLSQKYSLRLAVFTVHSRMNEARNRAIFTGIKHRLSFVTDRITLELFQPEEDRWIKEAVYFIEGARLQANNSPIFSPGGTVANLATIRITNGWGGWKITLAISGRIKTSPL